MADPLGQDGQRDDKKDVTLDFLGKPAPVAFKSQPALPSGGGAIGVGAGPATSAAGKGVGSVKRDAAFQQFVSDLAPFVDGAGGDSGAGPAAGPPGQDAVSGVNTGIIGTGVNALALAGGFPGMLGTISALAGSQALAGTTAVPGVSALNAATAVPGVGRGIAGTVSPNTTGLVGRLSDAVGRALSFSNLTTEDGKPVAALRTGLLDSMVAAIKGHANLATSEIAEIAALIADNPSLLNDPAFMAAPLANGRTISDTVYGLTPGVGPFSGTLTPGIAGTFGHESGKLGFDAYGNIDPGNPNAPAAPTEGGRSPALSSQRGGEINPDAASGTSPPGGPPSGPPGVTGFQGDPTGQEGDGGSGGTGGTGGNSGGPSGATGDGPY